MKQASSIRIRIDRLTNSIVNVISGDVFDTEVQLLTTGDAKKMKAKWQFDWASEMKENATYKLTVKDNFDVVQGAISLSDKGDHIYINLIENAPFNLGRKKVYEGVAGNLFAFACKLSFEKGYDGEISFTAKNVLIAHYEKTLGAKRIGTSNLMLVESDSARKLIQRYYEKQ
jgi:hypothetical protein